jgi:hypothetical protein
MGYYIQGPAKGKVAFLTSQYGAEELAGALVPFFVSSHGVICVVDNGSFEAAAYIHDLEEFMRFDQPHDPRPKVWLLMEKALAKQLSGHV